MPYPNPNILPADLSTFENNASAWSGAGTNATTAVQTTTKLSGTYGLRVTATAAGAAFAYTTTRVAVTTGSPYVLRIPIGLATAQSGLTAQATIEWWSASTGGTQISTVTGDSASIPNAVGFDPSGYPVVSGVVPAGATHANLKVAVSGLAANAQFFIDDVYLGLAPLLTGNLALFSVQSIESGISGWSVTNAAASRALDNATSAGGFYALQAVSSAASTVQMRPAANLAVTAGTEYFADAYVKVPSAGMAVSCYFTWADSSGTQIATSATTSTTVGTANSWSYVAVSATAPAGAAQGRMWVTATATASGQTFRLDEYRVRVAPNSAGNLLSYNDYSAEASLPPWLIDGPATVARTFFTSAYTDGSYAVLVTPTASGLIRATLDRLVPVVPGTSYYVGAAMARHAAVSGATIDSTFRSRVDWYDTNGDLFQVDNPDQFYTHTTNSAYEFHLNSETRVAPDGAAYAKVAFEWAHVQGTADLYYLDKVVLTPSPMQYTLASDDARGVTLLNFMVTTWAPNGVAAISVRRVDADGTASYVRGPGQEYNVYPYSGSTTLVEDYEAPVSTDVWYIVEGYNASGVATGHKLYTQTVAAPVIADSDYVWVKSPGIPARNVQVMMESPLKWQRTARSSTYEIVGRRNPVHITGTRAGRTGTLSLLVWDDASNDQFDRLLDSGLPVLIQAAPGYGVRGNLYLALGDSDCEPVTSDAREEGWRWTIPATEIDRPVGGLQGSALRTWQDVLTEYPTWGDVAAQPSWQAILMEE